MTEKLKAGTNRVLKYKVEADARGTRLPLAYRVLHVGQQDGVICVWVLADDTLDPSPGPEHFVTYKVYGTGWNVPGDEAYVGTVQIEDLAWHVFREGG